MATNPIIETERKLSVSVVRTSAELQRLGPEWKQLFQRIGCDNVFLSFEWLSEWWLHLGQGYQLFVVTVRDDGGFLVALAPLYICIAGGSFTNPRGLVFLATGLWVRIIWIFSSTRLACPQRWSASAILSQESRRVGLHRIVRYSRADSIAATGFRQTMQGGDHDHVAMRSVVCLPLRESSARRKMYFASLAPSYGATLNYYSRYAEA